MTLIDLRDRLCPVGDQGRRGTCVAFAVTAIHEVYHASGATRPDDLSEEVLFWGAKRIDGDASDGTRFTSAGAALDQWGQPPERYWSYDAGRDHRAADYSPPDGALDPSVCQFGRLREVELTRDGVLSELNAGRPVVIGIPMWEGLVRAASEPLPAPLPAEMWANRHAVGVVGYDSDRSSVLVRNSWGNGWGSDGYLWISDDLLEVALTAWAVDTGEDGTSQADTQSEGGG